MIKSIVVYLSCSWRSPKSQFTLNNYSIQACLEALGRTESVPCAGPALCFQLQRLWALCTLSRALCACSAPDEGLRASQGSAVVSGLGWALHSHRHCSGLSRATAGATCSAASCPHSTAFWLITGAGSCSAFIPRQALASFASCQK